jgi:hypothetical protein
MRGRVSADASEATIALRVLARAAGGTDRDERGFVEATVADGSTVALRVHDAEILWYGAPRRVPACQAGGEVLIGMSLLRGSTLSITWPDR